MSINENNIIQSKDEFGDVRCLLVLPVHTFIKKVILIIIITYHIYIKYRGKNKS